MLRLRLRRAACSGRARLVEGWVPQQASHRHALRLSNTVFFKCADISYAVCLCHEIFSKKGLNGLKDCITRIIIR